MTSSRPYLFRAIYDWIIDNGLTPYVLVNAEAPGAHVPEQHIEDGRIVLNISPRAVTGWHQDHEWLSFSARFSGVSREVSIPMHAVLAIYARENGKGMVFEKEEDSAPPPPPATPPPPTDGPKRGKPRLQVIK
ncbi:MAG: ClpXP protease specificity-enhancing factor [Chromatiales bacterium]|jgi:stringent starvation protein B|nr:ClpXP protease specificity-enhancing factor [Chromatiales bacterium]